MSLSLVSALTSVRGEGNSVTYILTLTYTFSTHNIVIMSSVCLQLAPMLHLTWDL